jgi:hypothetical protein
MPTLAPSATRLIAATFSALLFPAWLFPGILAGLACEVRSATAAAKEKASPPDFSSGDTAWLTFNVDFSIVPGGASPMRNDPAHPRISNQEAARTGRQPTYFIADLNGNTLLKPWVLERMTRDNAEVLAGKIAFTPHSSCVPAGVPGFHLYGFQPLYFIQTPKEVVMIYSNDQQVRRVYLDAPHAEAVKPSWYGESVGHYEDDTLVVDTIGLNDRTFVNNFRTPHTEKLHVVERFRLTDRGAAMQVDITFEDPDAFNAPWTVMQRYDRVQRPMTEAICAENNQHLFDYHIPVADTPDF